MSDATVQIDRIDSETIQVPIIGTTPLIVETDCWGCDGEGHQLSKPPRDSTLIRRVTIRCMTCNGTGRVPTNYGQAILNLVQKYGGEL